MFELLTGDVFEQNGELLTIFKIRIGVVAGMVNTHIHYSYQNQVKIKLVDTFCTMISEGLNDGTIKNINRPSDFS